jgi:hypothetical protein
VQHQLWPEGVCKELLGGRSPRATVNLRSYERLRGYYGHSLISSWLQRVWEKRECPPHESFEPFIYTWISFNGWAACVTGLDRDRQWLDALLVCPEVADDLERLVSDATSPLHKHARAFISGAVADIQGPGDAAEASLSLARR